MAVVIPDRESGNRDIWLIGLAGGGITRLTSHPANDWWPVWSPDSAQIAFASDRNGRSSIYRRTADGAGEEALLLGPSPSAGHFPYDWSTDGRSLAFLGDGASAMTDLADIWALPLLGDRKPVVLLRTAFTEQAPRFSPDARCVAYVSNESGTPEIYVRPSARPGKRRISLSGGTQPVWRRDGKELFFMGAGGTVMAAEVRAGDTVDATTPIALFQTCRANLSLRWWEDVYDVSADGKRILVNCPSPQVAPSSVTVAVHWAAAFKDEVP